MVELDFLGKSAADIQRYCKSRLSTSIPVWEEGLYQFVLSWYDERDFCLAYTSGSTGKPKEIRLNKKRMAASAQMTGKYLGLQAGDTALLCLPIRYIAGKMMVVRAAELQLSLTVVEPSLQPLVGIEDRFDFSAMVPNQVFYSLLQLDQVSCLLIGGGPISMALEGKLEQLPGAIFHTYGMTETITHVAMRRLNGPSARKSFQALPSVHFGVDERGCLTIDAPKISATQVITNDLVKLLGETQFIWLGRYDNIINSGGIKILPEQVEAKLSPILPTRYFVTSIPDPVLGERLILIIEGTEPMGRAKEKLNRKLEENLDRYEVPKELHWIENFAETASGKIQRAQTLSLLGK